MRRLGKFLDVERHPNFVLAAICIFAFGILIPFLGFYWDDWPTIFYTFNERTDQLINHFSYDRPFSVWAYLLVGLLGTTPITWHVAALALCIGGALALRWALQPLWPQQSFLVFVVALVFAIYPGYYLQPSAVIFLPHLASLALLLLSLGAMGRAALNPGRYRYYTFLGLAAAVVHMFTVEYFVGIELIRPLYVWFVLSNANAQKRADALSIAKLCVPYLVVFVAWVSWRLFFLALPSEPYPVIFVAELLANPTSAILSLAQNATADLAYTMVFTWAELVPSSVDLLLRFNLVILVAVILVAVTVYKILARSMTAFDPQTVKQGMLLGLTAFILGMFPVWAIGERIFQGDYNQRYILVGMFGASLLVVSLLAFLFNNARSLTLILSVMVALAIGSHLRAAEGYRIAWEEQRQFIWQLAWRAPGFETNTALIAFAPAAIHLRDPMTGNALNVAYPTAGDPPSVGLWNFELTRTATVRSIEAGEALTNDYRGLTFSTGSADDLVFYHRPVNGCLWVITPLDVDNAYLPVEDRDLVAQSNIANILTSPPHQGFPPQHIFGPEPEHGWCYYFEKASLAAQQQDWAAVIHIMDKADSLSLGPANGIEWLPLLSAHLAAGDFASALLLTEQVHAFDPAVDPMLCAHWRSYPSEHYEQATMIAGCD